MGSRSRRAATLPRSAAGGEHAPIAILGLGCVLPGGCDGPAALWRALESGGDLVGPLPDDRWSAAAHYSPDPAIPGKTVTRWGGFLQGIREFDAAFFGISPREAALVDPQQRLLLQVTWEALEDAGIPPDSLAGSATGVYVGISNSDYHAIQKLGPTGIDVHTGTGGALSIAANRISHRFDLRGPSIAIDTACSSALVALDAACRALWSGECTVALAGGVNVMLTPEVTISFSRASMLSPDGRCMAFDARANGYVRGEGAGVVVLKPLAAALADGDRIQAIIRATAVNQDGHTSTITVPSQPAQEAMLREACRRAAVDPALVGYVEAHGTGTAVGDPIEAGAIGAVFGRARSDGTRCLMGSIKTNIGHLESAAGIAGVIKAVLCLRHGAIPPNLHFVTPNPDIPFDALGIAVPTRLQPWPDRGGRRVAAVNSFGFGGTNACALLEAWPDRTAKAGAAPRRLVVPLSAASATALATQAGRIGQHLEQSKAPLAAVAATLAHRRAHLDHRLAVVAGSRPELARKLLAFSRGERAAGCIAGRASAAGKLAFVFTGQGAQWWAMGRGLLAADAVFRAAVEACDRLFQRLSGWSLIAALLADEASTRMGETAVAQPAMFALQVALAERWRAWGVVPDAVVGHSIGEIAAAYVSGALSLEDAVTVVYHRSRLQERSRGAGAMAAIGVPAARAGEMLAGFAGRLEIAAINGPSLVTVAGDTAELDRLLAALDAEGSSLFRRRLEVDLAFHSRQMDPHQPELTACLGGLRPGQARVAMISTVTAGPVADGELDATYWWRNMRQPVLFQPAIDRLIDDGHAAFLEIGPHAALAVPVTACLEQRGRAGYVVASLRRGQDDRDTMLQALGELHVRGHAIAWEGVIGRRHGFVDLPGNPWEKHAFWTESEEARAIRHDVPSHPLLGHRLRVAEPVWQVEIGRRLQPFLSDHCVDGAVVFPAAAYLEMLLAAARELFGDGPWEAEKIVFHEALMLGEDESAVMQTIYEPERSRVSILSRLRDREAGWTLRTTAQIRARPMQPPSADGWATLTLAPERIGADRLYRDLASEGHQFGPAFRGIELLWRADGMALGRIATPAALAAGGTAGHLMHPAILDSCLQVIRGFRGFPEVEEVGVVLPIGLRSLRCFRAVDGPIYSQARQVHHEAARVVADIVVFDEGGNIVASLDGFECRRWPRATPSEAAPPELYRELWRPRPDAAAAEPPADRPAATWLIFADRRGIGEALAAALEARGESCLVARVGERSRRIDKRRFELRVDAEAPLDRLLATARRARPPLAGIVHLWAIDGVGRDPGDAQLSGSLHLLALAQRLVAEAGDGVPRLWACGAGAWQPDGSAPRDDGGLATATLSGLCRALRTEHPQLRCTLLDLPLDKAVAADLAAELLADGDDAEVLLRPTGRHVGVIQRVAAEDLAPAVVRRGAGETALPFALTLPGPGRLDSMALREIALPVPGPGEVVIEVRAAGLNFRDVMAASGLLPAGAEDGDAWRSLGLECAGVVASVGDGVSRLRPGDEVIALARGCFASHLAVPEGLVFDKPKGLGFVDAACLPTAFLTAWHALVTQGRMTAGERVLITAAAGGVGQAAIQVATALGAEIYATAGSVEKRDHLRRLGIRHVFDSRSLDFADEVMAASDGAGVDLILNSQPGAFIEKGLSVLAPFGRFLEIGKRDIYLDTPVGLHALRNNASIMAVDLGRLPQQRPALLRDAMTAIFAGLESGTLRPLPVETFAVSRAADAFRRLSQARHIGKVALVMDEPDAAVALNEDRPLTLRPDGTYLVTGGLGGFGLATARWLADRGARRLLLLGRSAASAEALEAVAALGERGVEVRIEQADVTDLPRLESLVASIDPTTPLRGLVHAAMVLDDGFIRQLDADRFAKVVAPKMLGAWNLHRATAGCPLDFFVLYSSISALTGAAGQANYAAGNRYLDALAEHRRRCGLPALSIAWGAIADAGYLTRREDVARYLGSAGIEPMAAAEALAMLGRLLNQDVAAIAYARVDWAKLAALNPAVTATSRFAEVTAAIGTAHAGVGRIAAELAATPPAARPAVLTSYLQDKVGSVLRIDPAAVEPTRALAELGLDSLTSFELKGKVERELGVSVPIARFLQRPSVATLVAAFIERLDSAGQDGGGEGFGGGADDGTLSHGQEALWFLHRLAPTSPAYNLVYCVQIQPAPDGRALQEAFRGVLARHRVLRGAFLDDQGVPVQRLLDPESFSVEEHDARSLDDVDLRRVLSRCGNEPFTVTTGPLIQLHQFHRRDGDALLLKIHHLVVDAWSLSLVLSDLFAFYFAARDGVPAKLPPLSRGYADYVRWSRALVARPEGQVQLAYWRRQLADAPPLLELPTDRPRPATPSGEGGAVGFTIGAATTQKLRALAAAEGVTLFAVLLAAYQVLLLKLTGQRDLLVGVPVSGRSSAAFDQVVGYFVNPVVVRGQLDDAAAFAALLRRTDATVRAALEHQDYPFPLLVQALQADRDAGRSPLFQVAFAMERSARVDDQGFAVTLLNVAGPKLSLRGHAIETVGLDRNRAQFDLGFTVEEFDDRLYGIVDYRSDLFEKATIERFASWYDDLLARVAERPSLAIGEIALGAATVAPASGWRDDEFPDVVAAILAAARAAPENPAVSDADGTLSYRALVGRAAAVAAALKRRGAAPGSLVGIAVSRSAALPVALLGTLLAGAAFVPLDLAHPPARLATILDDAAPVAIVTETALLGRLPAGSPAPLLLDALERTEEQVAAVAVDGAQLAYLIYTSGSTGAPAGVRVPRRALANFIGAMRRLALLQAGDRLLAVTTPSFDIALLELLLPLAVGATTVVADEATCRDGRRLARRLESDAIDVMQATPATWAMLVDAGWAGASGFTALCGGEALPADLAAALLQRADAVWNLYGPTETTIWSTAARLVTADERPIGWPIANTLCRVLDDQSRPVPLGAVGELWIGGAGLADGYHRRPEATAARFVTLDGERFFRTGDLVRQSEDGALAFIARRDRQLKLRGFRIEPGEIEAALRLHPDVAAAAVAMTGDDLLRHRLVALVVPRAGGQVDAAALRSWLGERLPSHAVPADCRMVGALPLTANGKLDRGALANLAAGEGTQPRSPREPRSRDEIVLGQIAAELLGPEPIGVDDDLYERGATSLLMVRLVARAGEALGIDLAVTDLAGNPTIARLARRVAAIRERGDGDEALGLPAPVAGPIDWRPLALRRAADEIGPVEAVALAYLPDDLAGRGGTTRRQIAAELFEGRPSWHSVEDTPLGRIGLVVVPLFGADLFVARDVAAAELNRGIALAGTLGARCVSLTGLIPAATDFGRALEHRDSGPALTTGHATTAAAMVLSIANMLEQADRRLEDEAAAFVGLGSIGQATLRLMLDQTGHPAMLILCDLPARRPMLEALAEELRRDLGYHGRVVIATAAGRAPDAAYSATLLVGATNVPDVVDVARLAPGTLVVDDSFPPCLPVPAAAARLRTRGDILFTAGGFVRAPGRITRAIALPPAAARFAGHAGLRQALGKRVPDEITGCILSALLSVVRPDLPAQLGPVGLEACRAHLHALRALGFGAASLGTDAIAPTQVEIAAFRQRFGALDAA